MADVDSNKTELDVYIELKDKLGVCGGIAPTVCGKETL